MRESRDLTLKSDVPPPPPALLPHMQGYMPGQLYNLNSKYGDKDALLALLADLNAAGLKSIADIVISKSTRLQHAAGPAGPQHPAGPHDSCPCWPS